MKCWCADTTCPKLFRCSVNRHNCGSTSTFTTLSDPSDAMPVPLASGEDNFFHMAEISQDLHYFNHDIVHVFSCLNYLNFHYLNHDYFLNQLP